MTYQYRKRLHRKMTELKPNNLDELDGLEIVGQNMFDLDILKLPTYSYERLMALEPMHQNENEQKSNGQSRDGSVSVDNAHCDEVEAAEIPIIGPSIVCTPSDIILFHSSLHEEQTKILEMNNNGTTAMILRFENVEQTFFGDALFLYPTEQFAILPGERKQIAFYFKASKPGSYHLLVGIESFPSIPQQHIQLQAVCLIEDEDKMHRHSWMEQMKKKQIEQDATLILKQMVHNVPEPDPLMDNLPKSFCALNRDHKLYWYPDICESLQQLATTIIKKFRRRKRKSYQWDLKVSTLKQWLEELEGIVDVQVISDLELILLEYIESAQKMQPPNPLYYELCSNLDRIFRKMLCLKNGCSSTSPNRKRKLEILKSSKVREL